MPVDGMKGKTNVEYSWFQPGDIYPLLRELSTVCVDEILTYDCLSTAENIDVITHTMAIASGRSSAKAIIPSKTQDIDSIFPPFQVRADNHCFALHESQ
jgi:hypothetical protein